MKKFNLSRALKDSHSIAVGAANKELVLDSVLIGIGPKLSNRRLELRPCITQEDAFTNRVDVSENTMCLFVVGNDVWVFEVLDVEECITVTVRLHGSDKYTAYFKYISGDESISVKNSKTGVVILKQDMTTLETCKSRALSLWAIALSQKYGNEFIEADLLMIHSNEAQLNSCGQGCVLDWYCDDGYCRCCDYPSFTCKVPYDC